MGALGKYHDVFVELMMWQELGMAMVCPAGRALNATHACMHALRDGHGPNCWRWSPAPPSLPIDRATPLQPEASPLSNALTTGAAYLVAGLLPVGAALATLQGVTTAARVAPPVALALLCIAAVVGGVLLTAARHLSVARHKMRVAAALAGGIAAACTTALAIATCGTSQQHAALA